MGEQRLLAVLSLLVFLFAFALPGTAQTAPGKGSGAYIVSPALLDAIAAEYSGERALENVRGITQFHRIQASPGFTQAREWVIGQLGNHGITNVEVEKFPSDGRTRYSTHVGPMAWTVREGELWVEAPFGERLCRFTDQPVCLSTLSNGGEWRGEAIDVGDGTEAASYAGKDVRGKIVFASGYAGAVHRGAVIHRGALGVVIYPKPDDRPEHPDLVRYNGLWVQADEKEKAGFGFQISQRQWGRLRPLVAAGALRLHAKVDAELHPGALEVTSAYLRGSDPAKEIILVAHLDHYKFGANDNASGSASLVEIARTVKTLLEQKKIPPLRRTLHFLWVPEHFGTVAWLSKHPEVSARAIAALNLDMVGEDLFKTDSRLNISRTPDSLPSFLNDLVENVAEQVEAANLVSPNGSRHLFHWRMTPYSAGSDHDMFNDGNVRVPAVQFGHWPDWTHHTNEDSVDKVDSTTLRREMMRTTIRAKPKGIGLSEASPAMKRVPAKKYIGPIADGPASPWFRQALGSDYAWWHEQELKFPQGDLIPRFALIVYEAGNFADGKRSLAEIEGAITAECGDLPAGLIEGMFNRLATIGLVEWVEPSK